jgi:hypothetical protein
MVEQRVQSKAYWSEYLLDLLKAELMVECWVAKKVDPLVVESVACLVGWRAFLRVVW